MSEYLASVFYVDHDNCTVPRMHSDDGAWLLANTFLILSMQSGFALLECGFVARKNRAHIMVKNMVDISVGGLSYWMFGYGLAYGHSNNQLFGTTHFFLAHDAHTQVGIAFTDYVFQFAMATTATTIVSGAVTERMSFEAYVLYSFVSPLLYSFPAYWVWNKNGFLRQLGFTDAAGASVVHVYNGMNAFVATIMLGPRHGRFRTNDGNKTHRQFGLSNPITALTGCFMLWWGCFGFNCGSSLGINGPAWRLAATAAVNTIHASVAGGVIGLILARVFRINNCKCDISTLIVAVLAGCFSITGVCGFTGPTESIMIGAIGSVLAVGAVQVVESAGLDDAVGVLPVHLVSAAWGVFAVALFAKRPLQCAKRAPLFEGVQYGEWRAVPIQLLGLFVVCLWAAVTSYVILNVLKWTVGLRVSSEHEEQGADWVVHGIGNTTNTTDLSSSEAESAQVQNTLREMEELLSGLHNRVQQLTTHTNNLPIDTEFN